MSDTREPYVAPAEPAVVSSVDQADNVFLGYGSDFGGYASLG